MSLLNCELSNNLLFASPKGDKQASLAAWFKKHSIMLVSCILWKFLVNALNILLYIKCVGLDILIHIGLIEKLEPKQY